MKLCFELLAIDMVSSLTTERLERRGLLLLLLLLSCEAGLYPMVDLVMAGALANLLRLVIAVTLESAGSFLTFHCLRLAA